MDLICLLCKAISITVEMLMSVFGSHKTLRSAVATGYSFFKSVLVAGIEMLKHCIPV